MSLQMQPRVEKQRHQHNESPAMIDTVGPSDTIAAPVAQLFIMRTRLVLPSPLLPIQFSTSSLPHALFSYAN